MLLNGVVVSLSCYRLSALKYIKRNHRAVIALAVFTCLLILLLAPGVQPIYGEPCKLTLSSGSLASARNVTFGHLALDFGRQIRLRLFSDERNSSIGGQVVLSAVIGQTLRTHAPYRLAAEPGQLRLVFPDSGVRLTVSRCYKSCYRITWKGCSGLLRDTFQLSGAVVLFNHSFIYLLNK